VEGNVVWAAISVLLLAEEFHHDFRIGAAYDFASTQLHRAREIKFCICL